MPPPGWPRTDFCCGHSAAYRPQCHPHHARDSAPTFVTCSAFSLAGLPSEQGDGAVVRRVGKHFSRNDTNPGTVGICFDSLKFLTWVKLIAKPKLHLVRP